MSNKISNTTKIERQLQGILVGLFTERIKERKLENRIFPYPTIEENYADITLKHSSDEKPIFFIELKDPSAKDGQTLFDSKVLLREIERAEKIGVEYFGVCNFISSTLIDKRSVSSKVAFSDGFFNISEINRLRGNVSPSPADITKKKNIVDFYLDKALEIIEKDKFTPNPIDEVFIFKIRKLMDLFINKMTRDVFIVYESNKTFEKKITEYTQKQQWNKPQTYEEIESITYLSMLMLISKVIFYKSYREAIYKNRLSKMSIPSMVRQGSELEELLWEYFEEFREVTGNFELLIGEREDVNFQLPFLSNSSIDFVKAILEAGEAYNFSKVPYDVLGRIFEGLIRNDKRHKLGQYFTPPLVIDFINSFCIKNASDVVLDPSCGSGTFLVRAYERKKKLGMSLHTRLLKSIYGSDISNYASYLAMLNLATRNMENASYPRVLHRDFFSLRTDKIESFHIDGQNLEEANLPQFDAIVGNPPYTRQEDVNAFNENAKSQIHTAITKEWGSVKMSKQTSIYAYFIYYASAFLKEGGYLGFVVSNSWLDNSFGKEVQDFLIDNFEIIAIVASEKERFFESAEVNTNILIIRKQSSIRKAHKNKVKFVHLHDTLNNLEKKYNSIEDFANYIELSNDDEKHQDYSIRIIEQKELKKYSKWSVFLKAPDIYWEMLKKGKNNLVSLGSLAEVRFGIKTGNNNFFIVEDFTDTATTKYLAATINNIHHHENIKSIVNAGLRLVKNGLNEFWLIEDKYLRPILASPKDVDSYNPNLSKITAKIIIVNESKKSLYSNTYIRSYIDYGESIKINKGKSCENRKLWYSINKTDVPVLSFNYMINDVGRTYIGNILTNDNFHNIYTEESKAENIFIYLNSTISWLLQNVIARTSHGGGVVKIQKYEFAEFPIINIDFSTLKIKLDKIKNYKEELGDGTDLSSINPERIKLDSAILEAIGFEKEHIDKTLIDLYTSVVNLIDSRLKRSKSVKSTTKKRDNIELSIYIKALEKMVKEAKIDIDSTDVFAYKLQDLVKQMFPEIKMRNKIIHTYWEKAFNEKYDLEVIIAKKQGSLF